ncbi:MAG: DNA starvation/stationary phase protection protein [Alphaproteobacteria bacterium]|nr:DNA starvation/stationary phase protection protein [Alphaproteobacteria bacterium]MBU1514115.1 DNA starvation/stationary phase protection protein [Alphaproteobacteria bacterium]MBU2096236.1 DNA starvation/stationary phase protection protein [Alphaproteobacteria bacterium]MBU2151190.1 DNA starvation/stationary phase protection protein [Alphaproteobacteria bacterium]MBU2307151.1 DNA starvation/stationary phase protection protein [Alphaproteobacteria bacterium]
MADKSQKKVAAGLSKLLADTYAVYLKTHGYHWNVRGPTFGSLHNLFMTQYTEMWASIDLIAERIRALGEYAPQGYGAFAELSDIKDGNPKNDADAMLKELVADHATLVATAKAARDGADDVTASLIDARVEAHEKHAWMLRVSIS